MATLNELDSIYSVEDVMRMIEIIDAKTHIDLTLNPPPKG